MSATIEHTAAKLHQRRTACKLAREIGHTKTLALLYGVEPPADDLIRRDYAERDIGESIRNGASILGRDAAIRLAMDAITDMLRGK